MTLGKSMVGSLTPVQAALVRALVASLLRGLRESQDTLVVSATPDRIDRPSEGAQVTR